MTGDSKLDPLGLFDSMPDEIHVGWNRVGPLGVPVPDPSIDPRSDAETVPEGDVVAAAQVGEEYLDRVESAIETEECEFCEAVLRGLRNRPLDEQVQGVQELAELKEEMKGDFTAEGVEETLDGFEVLDDPDKFL